MVDFIFVVIELFSLSPIRLRRCERKSVEVGIFRRRWVTLSADFRGKGRRPPTTLGIRVAERLPFVWYQNICSALFSFVTIHACDRQTDGHIDGQNNDSQDRPRICSRDKNKIESAVKHKSTDKQTPLKTSNALRYATTLGNDPKIVMHDPITDRVRVIVRLGPGLRLGFVLQ